MFFLFKASSSIISRYDSQMWQTCLIKTKILTSANEKSSGVCTIPGLTSSSNSENCVVLLFSKRPIEKQKHFKVRGS